MEDIGSLLVFGQISVTVMSLAPTLVTSFDQCPVPYRQLVAFYIALALNFSIVALAAIRISFYAGQIEAFLLLIVCIATLGVALVLLGRWTIQEQLNRARLPAPN